MNDSTLAASSSLPPLRRPKTRTAVKEAYIRETQLWRPDLDARMRNRAASLGITRTAWLLRVAEYWLEHRND